jgi:methanogenic corrinoid protein MtbC1
MNGTVEFNLRDLNDRELIERIHDDLYNGLKAPVLAATQILLERGWSAERTLNDALVEGMRIVGIDFRDGILFVPEVFQAVDSAKGALEILRPLLDEHQPDILGMSALLTTTRGSGEFLSTASRAQCMRLRRGELLLQDVEEPGEDRVRAVGPGDHR